MKSVFKQLGAGLPVTILAGLLVLTGCATNEPAYVPPPNVGVPPNLTLGPTVHNNGTNVSSPLLRVGDLVIIEWFDMPTQMLPFKDKVRDDGNLVLPYNVMVKAAGLTASQLQDEIRKAYVPSLFKHLTISVKTEERFYFVDGEVKQPNRHYYYGDMTVLRAINTSGGFTDFADKKKIELRRPNGEQYMIDYKKAMRNQKLDLPVYPSDQVIVHKRWL